ncbi:MAG: UDP-N-acetylglucosamine 1-carboxyvinyltransferase [Verrucomicrobia bacterium]|nr:UDP-N-acetylglucosamine 1-carboxyvinyltransferase [Verrucomicrobiota bacterium]
MDKFVINGGTPLKGEVAISGSKNAALPILAATLLTPERCVIRGVPDLSDTRFMVEIIRHLGAEAEFKDGVVTVEAKKVRTIAPYELVRKMRASVCLLGPMLGRRRKAKVSVPGGCIIGPRPIDIHLKGFRALGADVRVEKGYVIADGKNMAGSTMFLGGRFGSTVLGTGNVMMAAAVTKGTTVIESAACEPEVVDLAQFLAKMGAQIHGAGSPTLTIYGVEQLHGAEHTVIPDRIEAGTFMTAAAVTGGRVTLKGARPDHLGAVIDKLLEAGVKIERAGPDLTVNGEGKRTPADVITMPYPGFPTDMQAQFMTIMTITAGISVITEKIYPERFMHVAELGRLGADVALEGSSAIVKGVPKLSGAPIMASDLRASAALVLAGLVAHGQTTVNRVYHIDRGYERIDEKLRALGARIERRK